MQTVTTLAPYEDDRGNRIIVPDGFVHTGRVSVVFKGSNNVLKVGRRPNLRKLHVQFDCSDGRCVIGSGKWGFAATIRVGQDSVVRIGDDTSMTEVVGISAVEGAKVIIGKDVMIATQVQLRTDDGHPIFDVRTGERVNPARTVRVGDHVWLGWGSVLLGGAKVGSGSVVGMGSVLKRSIPNNVIAVGSPAKVVRRDIAWERPHLSLTEPFYKPDSSTVTTHDQWWNLTEDPVVTTSPKPSFVARVKRRLTRR
ncbi:acyltransferase [Nocardioides yefusunii]|uniref:Acyltransferase n=1 Tax=Nocardioides yefusunii TaxID=2500546 RepID=A0ABW1QZN0_9ACTN|nr:acyltransferase [Nocardioides yefusunii]